MYLKIPLRIGFVGCIGGFCAVYSEEMKNTAIGILRFGRAAKTVVIIVSDYRHSLYSGKLIKDSPAFLSEKSKVHARSAQKLLNLCCMNGGAFIKVGQHLGSLEYLLPHEYVNTLKILHSKAPKSSLEDINDVIRFELKKEPLDLFKEFEPDPLGAASLAQVHKARLKDGREVAVKVQHPSVLNHSVIDMKGMEILTKCVSWIFPDFNFDWLVEETKKNLPLELDFVNEGKNAERVSALMSHFPWFKVPSIDWSLTTSRVLTMEFCEGGQVNDLQYMRDNNIDTYDVSRKLSDLYSEMIFVNGFVHCDPHPGNVLVNKKDSKTYLILVDHGLYITLSEKFRLTYGKLWQSILNADIPKIESLGRELGLGDLYGLFVCMVTARSWESIGQGIDRKEVTPQEEDQVKGDAAKYLPEIAAVLRRVPRQMLLIFKTNDLIRGIEYSLNTSKGMNSFISMARCCNRAVYNQQRKFCSSRWCLVKTNVAEILAQFKLTVYTFYLFILRLPALRSIRSIIQREISASCSMLNRD